MVKYRIKAAFPGLPVMAAGYANGSLGYIPTREAFAEKGYEITVGEETADRLARVTCFGAGAMLASSPGEAAELRRRVTSPNGTTHAAMTVLEAEGYHDLVKRAADAARRRSRELSGETS